MEKVRVPGGPNTSEQIAFACTSAPALSCDGAPTGEYEGGNRCGFASLTPSRCALTDRTAELSFSRLAMVRLSPGIGIGSLVIRRFLLRKPARSLQGISQQVLY